MKNRNSEPRFDGHSDRINFEGRALPYESGELSKDFRDRIIRLKETSGLTWGGFSLAVGASRKQVRRWRREGVEPSGGPMLSLVRFARRIPGGLVILMGEGFQMNLWENEEEDAEEDDQEQDGEGKES